MAEFGVVVGAFLLVLFATMEMASAAYSYHIVSTVAREGVRYAITHSPTSANPESPANIQTYAAGYASGLDTTNLTVAATFCPHSDSTCTLAPAASVLPDARVVVTYNYPLTIPFMSRVTLTLSSSSRMLVSQ